MEGRSYRRREYTDAGYYQHAVQFVGQPVIAHLHYGKKHYGARRGTLASAGAGNANIATVDQPEDLKGEQVYWGPGWGWGAAAFFLPFLALAAITPFLWW